jgi:hypothetical protein
MTFSIADSSRGGRHLCRKVLGDGSSWGLDNFANCLCTDRVLAHFANGGGSSAVSGIAMDVVVREKETNSSHVERDLKIVRQTVSQTELLRIRLRSATFG